MIKVHGWNATAGHLGMSVTGLENRVYERKGQAVSTQESMLLQSFSDTKMFAQAVASKSGGVFIQLPQSADLDNESLLAKFNELHMHLGLLSQRFNEATLDGEVNKRDAADLSAIGDEIHKNIQELLSTTFAVFCRQSLTAASKID